MSDGVPTWYIKCGSLEGSAAALTAEQAFLSLVDNHDGDLARLFRASRSPLSFRGGGRGRYYSTENVLSSVGLWDTQEKNNER